MNLRSPLSVLCAAAGLAPLLLAPPVSAGDTVTRATLSWVRLPGAEACIAAPALAEAVEERLGHPVFSPASKATLSLEGWIEPAQRPLSWRAIVTVADASGKVLGSREILSAAASCEEIVAPLSLGIALMIDPTGPREGSEGDEATAVVVTPSPGTSVPRPGGDPQRAPEPPSQADKPTSPARPPAEGLFQMTLGPLLGVGILPGIDEEAASLGALARIVLGPPGSWGVEIQGAVFPPHPIASGSVHRFHLAALGCPVRRIAVVRLDFCAGIASGALGQLHHEPRPVVDGQLDARVGYRAGRTPLLFSLGALLGVPLIHHDIAASRRTYLTAPVYGMVDLAVGVELP
jgi:hypothetical protein